MPEGRPEMGGSEDRAAGTWDEAKGKVKEGVGDATDNRSLEAEGLGDQVKGKAQRVKGEVKDEVDDALDDD
jgi:uncharacterized protein YjbJ (UPF0337 family)